MKLTYTRLSNVRDVKYIIRGSWLSVKCSLPCCIIDSRPRLFAALFAATIDNQVHAYILPLHLNACTYIVGPSSKKGVCT